MEHHNSWITEFVNLWIGPSVAAFLNAIGVHPHDPAHPIPEFVVMSVIVLLFVVVFVLWLKPRLSVERPGAVQQCVEILLTNPIRFGIRDLLDDNIDHGGRKFMAVVGSVAVFVLAANLISVFPIFTSPTIHPSVPLGCALLTFCYFNYQGMRRHGVGGYLKHFTGPVWWMAWLIFPVEIISTSARILSLTVRLWANMFSSELIYVIILGMLVGPVGALLEKGSYILAGVVGIFAATLPVMFVALHIFVAVVQAFVFTILPSVYLGLAVGEEH